MIVVYRRVRTCSNTVFYSFSIEILVAYAWFRRALTVEFQLGDWYGQVNIQFMVENANAFIDKYLITNGLWLVPPLGKLLKV